MGKVEFYLFAFISVFMAVIDVIYWYSSHDPTGTTCILLAALLGGLCAFYLGYVARHTGPRPEDRVDAEIADGSGDLAHFSPGSPWPIAMAFSAAGVMYGIIFGLWISFIFAVGFLYALTGLLFEHYRGNNLHTEESIGIDPVGMHPGHI